MTMASAPTFLVTIDRTMQRPKGREPGCVVLQLRQHRAHRGLDDAGARDAGADDEGGADDDDDLVGKPSKACLAGMMPITMPTPRAARATRS